MSVVTDETQAPIISEMLYHYERALILAWVIIKSLFTLDCLTMVDFSCINISVRCHVRSAGLSKMFTEGQTKTFERYISGDETESLLKDVTSTQMAPGTEGDYRQLWVLFLNAYCSQCIQNHYIGLSTVAFPLVSIVIWNAWWYPDSCLYVWMFQVSFPALSWYLGYISTVEKALEV